MSAHKTSPPTRRPKIYRRQICVDPKLQILLGANMMLIALTAMLAALVFASWFYIYFFNGRLWAEIDTAFRFKVLLFFGLTLCGVLIWTVFRSHAIAGPIYKVRKVLQAAAQGEFPDRPVRFRRGDAFRPLAEDLNRCLEIMKAYYAEHAEQDSDPEAPHDGHPPTAAPSASGSACTINTRSPQ
jgi:hypothetical protein